MQLLDKDRNVIGEFDRNSEVRSSGKKNTVTFNVKSGTEQNPRYSKKIIDVESLDKSFLKVRGKTIELSTVDNVFETILNEFLKFIEYGDKDTSSEESTSTENDSPSEFDYTPVEGTITKLFVHKGKIAPLTSVSEYADFENMQNLSSEDWMSYDGKYIVDVDGCAHFFRNDGSFTISDENIDSFVIDVNLTSSSSFQSVITALEENEHFTNIFNDIGFNFKPSEDNVPMIEEAMRNGNYGGVFFADSKKCFSDNTWYDAIAGYDVFKYLGNTTTFSEMIDTAHQQLKSTSYNYSETYNASLLIEKALETGRALDIVIPIPRSINDVQEHERIFNTCLDYERYINNNS